MEIYINLLTKEKKETLKKELKTYLEIEQQKEAMKLGDIEKIQSNYFEQKQKLQEIFEETETEDYVEYLLNNADRLYNYLYYKDIFKF